MSQKNLETTLSLPIFYILLSLASKERHGYNIMKTVEEESNGKVAMGPGTLYGAIKRMLKDRLIQEIPAENPRRRLYKITDKGRFQLNSELERYQDAVDLAQRKKLLTKLKLAMVTV